MHRRSFRSTKLEFPMHEPPPNHTELFFIRDCLRNKRFKIGHAHIQNLSYYSLLRVVEYFVFSPLLFWCLPSLDRKSVV